MPKRFRFFLALQLLCSVLLFAAAPFALPRAQAATRTTTRATITRANSFHGFFPPGDFNRKRALSQATPVVFAIVSKAIPASRRNASPKVAARSTRKPANQARFTPGDVSRNRAATGRAATGRAARNPVDGKRAASALAASRMTAARAATARIERRARGRALWKSVLWAQAIVLCLAGVVAWLVEKAQPRDQSAAVRGAGRRNWLRPRELFARARGGGDDDVPATGWAHETLSHSLRAERTRAALPRLWPFLLGLTRWALLAVFVLPAAALCVSVWMSLAPVARPDVRGAAFLVSGTAAAAALLLARWRARGLGTFALLLCSTLSVATIALALLHDALARDIWSLGASRSGDFKRAGATAGEGASWLMRSLLGGADFLSATTQSNAASSIGNAVPIGAVDAGYLIGATLVCATAWVMGRQMARRSLFDRPPVEIRHVHPLSLPLPQDVRARLHWALFCVPVALALALQPVGDAPGIASMLALAVALCLCGWRFKVLGARQFASALAFALVTIAALWLIWIISGGALRSDFADQKTVLNTQVQNTAARRNTVKRSGAGIRAEIPATRGTTTLSGGLIPGSATGTGTIGKATRQDSLATDIVAAVKNLGALPALWLRRAIGIAPFLCGALILLAATLWLLKRPPAHLWSNLSLAPAWGWMLLGGTSALLVAPLLLQNGQSVALALGMALLPAFLFVWLERA